MKNYAQRLFGVGSIAFLGLMVGWGISQAEEASAAFITERVSCPNEGGEESSEKEHSAIFAGSYTISGNQITIEDDFGTDEAVIKGDVLVYETGGDGRPTEEFVFIKE
jgi:hypothetical protein